MPYTPHKRRKFHIVEVQSQVGITSSPDTTIPRWDDLSMRTHMKAQAKASWATICLRIVEIILRI